MWGEMPVNVAVKDDMCEPKPKQMLFEWRLMAKAFAESGVVVATLYSKLLT